VVPEVDGSKQTAGSWLQDTSLGMAVVGAAVVVVVAVEELTEPVRPGFDARMSQHRVESVNCL
jgi:hypothetical protein